MHRSLLSLFLVLALVTTSCDRPGGGDDGTTEASRDRASAKVEVPERSDERHVVVFPSGIDSDRELEAFTAHATEILEQATGRDVSVGTSPASMAFRFDSAIDAKTHAKAVDALKTQTNVGIAPSEASAPWVGLAARWIDEASVVEAPNGQPVIRMALSKIGIRNAREVIGELAQLPKARRVLLVYNAGKVIHRSPTDVVTARSQLADGYLELHGFSRHQRSDAARLATMLVSYSPPVVLPWK